MDITTAAPPAFNGLTAAKGTDGTASENAGKDRQLSSDFETFLRMLTVQMQNQDPLNPVDSSDYAVQLATFSSVEQQVLTNDLLRALGNQLNGGSLGQLSGWVGMQALARAPVAFDGTPVHLRPDFAPNADSATLVVRDAAGSVVSRDALAIGQDSVVWAGASENGSPLRSGTYRFEVESHQNGKLIDTRTAQAYSKVEEARISGDTILLRLSDGSEVDADRVAGIRTAG